MTVMIRTHNYGRQHRQSITRPGAVAGAVLRAARRSAHASTTLLAAGAGFPKNTITSWENGSLSLANQPVPILQRLEASLAALGADPLLISDLDAAAWCDLIFTTVDQHEDLTGLLAEPITNESEFRDLLAWSLAGQTPARYARYLPPASPITSKTLTEHTRHAITSAHPALAAACLPQPAPVPAWQRQETRHRHHGRDHHTRHCPADQPRQPQRRIPWTCHGPGRRSKRVQ